MDAELYLGDCLEIMPGLEADRIDAIITDIPYGTTNCSWDEVIPLTEMWEQVKRLTGTFITTASQPFTSVLVVSNLEWFKHSLVFQKSRPTGFLDAKRRPLNDIEDICVFSKNQFTYNPQMWIGERQHKNGKNNKTNTPEQYGDIKRLPVSDSSQKYPRRVLSFKSLSPGMSLHPTQKPVSLYKYLIDTYTNPGDTVLDIAMGVGSSGIASMETGRNFIGIEIGPKYFEIANKRITAAKQQLLLPLDLEAIEAANG